MLLRKFSLMDPNEHDRYEQRQYEEYRPAATKDVPIVAKNLLDIINKGTRPKGGTQEEKLLIRITNMIASNNVFKDYSGNDILDMLSKPKWKDLSYITLCHQLKLDTNKGSTYQTMLNDYDFEDGGKATEQEAKDRLIKEYGMTPEDFILLPDAGPNAIYVDEKNKKLIKAKDKKFSLKRSIDAITETDSFIIAWGMKYKGGTAAVDGSTQADQGKNEGAGTSKVFEDVYLSGNEITYNDKPVFFVNLVYGSQFQNEKRIAENELAFKQEIDCKRSVNCSLSNVVNIINEFKSLKAPVDNIVEILYDKYAYDINYTGRKGKERLQEWIFN